MKHKKMSHNKSSQATPKSGASEFKRYAFGEKMKSFYKLSGVVISGLILAGCATGSHWIAYSGPEMPDSKIAQITRDEPRITRNQSPEAREVTINSVCGRDVINKSGGFLPYRIDIKPQKCEIVINYTEIVRTPGLEAIIGHGLEKSDTQVKQTFVELAMKAGNIYHITSDYDFKVLEIYINIIETGKTTRTIAPKPKLIKSAK